MITDQDESRRVNEVLQAPRSLAEGYKLTVRYYVTLLPMLPMLPSSADQSRGRVKDTNGLHKVRYERQEWVVRRERLGILGTAER